METNNAIPFEAKEARGRLPYALTPTLEHVRDNARDVDVRLEEAGTTVLAALADDGVIDRNEALDILAQLIPAERANSASLSTLNLLLEAGKEPAQREVERVDAKRKRIRQTVKYRQEQGAAR